MKNRKYKKLKVQNLKSKTKHDVPYNSFSLKLHAVVLRFDFCVLSFYGISFHPLIFHPELGPEEKLVLARPWS